MMLILRRLGGHAAKILIVLLLGIPALISLVHRDHSTIENRTPAIFPARPATWNALLQYPSRLDLWINDHFGLRKQLVTLNNQVRYRLFRQFPTHQVIEGRNGRIFLAAHAREHMPYSAIFWSCGAMPFDKKVLAAQLNNFFSAYTGLGLDPKLIIVPSAPALYPEDLPAWLEARCALSSAPIPRVLMEPTLVSEMRARTYYPIEAMRSVEPSVHAIPKTWFHWTGVGPRVVAVESARRFWSLSAPQQMLASRAEPALSDISHLFEGILLSSDVEVTDYAASKIDACEGPQCFPELGTIAQKLADVSRYRNERAPAERLVLLSDSYGRFVAGAYAPFFREVIHFSTNALALLNQDELNTLRKVLSQRDGKQKLLFVYHDASVLTGRVEVDRRMLVP